MSHGTSDYDFDGFLRRLMLRAEQWSDGQTAQGEARIAAEDERAFLAHAEHHLASRAGHGAGADHLVTACLALYLRQKRESTDGLRPWYWRSDRAMELHTRVENLAGTGMSKTAAIRAVAAEMGMSEQNAWSVLAALDGSTKSQHE